MKSHQQIRQERLAQAAETLKDHTYTALIDTPECQVWRCQRPGSSVYGFDITITRFGIAVMGDIDCLVFRVGSSYGMEFLAGDDVGYYIHSKLESTIRDSGVELDEEHFQQILMDGVCEVLQEHEARFELPDWMSDERARQGKFDALRDFIDEERDKSDALDLWTDLESLLGNAYSLCGISEAYDFMRDHYEELGIGEDWWDYSLRKPSECLMRRLYMVNHAAKQIMAQKQAVAA
ncbi:hypothetical protein NG726_11785 [Pseudomonas sp. MOB-449]|nr:hypothetical protein [Pseudomonas sp. MOB-449]